MRNTKLKSMIGAAVLGLSVLGSGSSFAEITFPQSLKAFEAMDVNRDGKLSRDEFLVAMGKVFDKHAGAKGYCSPEEAAGVMNDLENVFLGSTFAP